MIVNFSFKNLDPSDSLRGYASEKSSRLEKYFHGKIHLSWTFSLEKLDHIAHCHLVGNHMDYFGEAKSESFMGSIDLAIDKIERQLKKHKEIVKDHKG